MQVYANPTEDKDSGKQPPLSAILIGRHGVENTPLLAKTEDDLSIRQMKVFC